MARRQPTDLTLEHVAGGLIILFLTYLVRRVIQDLAQQMARLLEQWAANPSNR